MLTRMRVWPVLLLLLTTLTDAGEDVANLQKQLKTILNNELGIEQMQRAEIKYKDVVVDWVQNATDAAQSIGKIFTKHFEIVRKTRDAVSASYGEFSQDTFEQLNVKQCCRVNEDSLNTVVAVGRKADTDKPCVRYAKDNTAIVNPLVSQKLIEAMKNGNSIYAGDFNTLGMKWLYYGDELGTYTIYPGHRDRNECYFYDPRSRPWYAVSASPLPKDIVIVLAMSEQSFATKKTSKIIVDAANTVIDTMNEDDRVGIVYFGASDEKPQGCHQVKLGYAIPATRRKLQEANLKRIQATPIQGNIYSVGIDAAFALMNSADNDNSTGPRKKAILFMADGGPQETDDSILMNLREKVSSTSDEILILTYGIENTGTNNLLKQEDKDLLEKMTNVTKDGNIQTLQENLADRFTILNETTDLRFKIGRYYRFFAKTSTNPIVTVPYMDYTGIGLVVSICLPVYYSEEDTLQDTLRGVTCVDMSVSDLKLMDLSVQDGYMFLFNKKNSRTLLHPLLPDPGHAAAFAADPVFLDIAVLEPDAQEILEEMKKGFGGERTINTTWTTSRGSSARDGVKTQTVKATYHYRPINDTDFAMAIVVPLDDQRMEIVVKDEDNFYPKKVHYCGHTDEKVEVELCNNHGTAATKDTSCIFLAPEARVGVGAVITATNLEKYLENDQYYQNEKTKLQAGIKEMVAITDRLETIWKNQPSHSVEILWKYIVTYNGVLRLFPAVNMSHSLDYLHSNWFAKAVEESKEEEGGSHRSPDKDVSIIITTPRYEDFTGSNVVVSLLTNVLEPSTNDSGKHIAVMGMDISLLSIQGIIKDSVPECDTIFSCFLMDRSGYIISHDKFIESSDPSQYVGGKHITEMEEDVAYYLIEKGYMEKQHCISFVSIWNHSTWRMSAKSESYDAMDTLGFSITKVPLTNTYLVKMRSDGVTKAPGQCDCDTKDSEEPGLAKCDSDLKCQCPCYIEDKNYQRCSNKFDHIGDIIICTPNQTSLLPSKPKWAVDSPSQANISGLYAPCFHVTCSSIQMKWQCSSFSQCRWCSNLKDNPCVATNQECKGPGVNPAAIVVPVLFIIGVMAAVGAFLLYRWRKGHRPNQKNVDNKPELHVDIHNESIESIYNTVDSESSPDGLGIINDTYLTTPPIDNGQIHYGFEAPGAPKNKPITTRIPSCTGLTPPGPPPEDFPPGSPGNYLTMGDFSNQYQNQDHDNPANIPVYMVPMNEDWSQASRSSRQAPQMYDHPVQRGQHQRDEYPQVHRGQVPRSGGQGQLGTLSANQRQSMPLPLQPLAVSSPPRDRSQSASTLPRQLTPLHDLHPFPPLSSYPPEPPEPPPLREPDTQFPYADMQETRDVNEEFEFDEQYLTMPSSSQTNLNHLSSSQTKLPRSRTGSSSDAPHSPESGIASTPTYLPMDSGRQRSTIQEEPMQRDQDSDEPDSNETVISVRL